MAAMSDKASADRSTRFTTVLCNQTRYRTVASERKCVHQASHDIKTAEPPGNDAARTSTELYETFVNLGGHIQCDQPYTRLTVGLAESPRRTVATVAGHYCIVGVRCQPTGTAYTLVLQRDDKPPVRQKYAPRPCVAVVCP